MLRTLFALTRFIPGPSIYEAILIPHLKAVQLWIVALRKQIVGLPNEVIVGALPQELHALNPAAPEEEAPHSFFYRTFRALVTPFSPRQLAPALPFRQRPCRRRGPPPIMGCVAELKPVSVPLARHQEPTYRAMDRTPRVLFAVNGRPCRRTPAHC